MITSKNERYSEEKGGLEHCRQWHPGGWILHSCYCFKSAGAVFRLPSTTQTALLISFKEGNCPGRRGDRRGGLPNPRETETGNRGGKRTHEY